MSDESRPRPASAAGIPTASAPLWIPAFAGMTGGESGNEMGENWNNGGENRNDGGKKHEWRGQKAGMTVENRRRNSPHLCALCAFAPLRLISSAGATCQRH